MVDITKNRITINEKCNEAIKLKVLITAASAADAGIHKKVLGSGTTTLIIWNDEMEDTVK